MTMATMKVVPDQTMKRSLHSRDRFEREPRILFFCTGTVRENRAKHTQTHPSYPFVIEVIRTRAIMAVKTACRPRYHLISRPLRSESRVALGPAT